MVFILGGETSWIPRTLCWLNQQQRSTNHVSWCQEQSELLMARAASMGKADFVTSEVQEPGVIPGFCRTYKARMAGPQWSVEMEMKNLPCSIDSKLPVQCFSGLLAMPLSPHPFAPSVIQPQFCLSGCDLETACVFWLESGLNPWTHPSLTLSRP